MLFLPCNTHKSESILVHEVAHSVMNIGFDDSMMVRRGLPLLHQRSKRLIIRFNSSHSMSLVSS